MKQLLLLGFLSCAALTGQAQSTPMQVPAKASSQLADLMDLTKAEVSKKSTVKAKTHAEARPELNRYLVISANDFLQVTNNAPTKEAYLQCIDKGLARLAPLTTNVQDRQQVAEYFQELMEIVGLESSDGRLASFVAQPKAEK
ncbi:DUF4844 domain-containing protein [Hymenobacter negativus]|uniref:DUF4844 domain-containing protein n=1 Tax=Hymenobacter negativus TaxID=2795026 RepID=A0ABS3QGP1_9BACT|nr:DUF4844 domain-containing protein [Hymenobacter negativus]MBO2010415.1 DUF4844 domain-containing protein [Hymenobacter negativus]